MRLDYDPIYFAYMDECDREHERQLKYGHLDEIVEDVVRQASMTPESIKNIDITTSRPLEPWEKAYVRRQLRKRGF